jgi:glutaconyl-CoA/methylmalonyl-CoA decarboxylase subunit gamma
LRRLEDVTVMIKHLRVTVDGKAYDVVVEELAQDADAPPHSPVAASAPRAAEAAPPPAPKPAAAAPASSIPSSAGPDDRTAPLSGIVAEIVVSVGDAVEVDQPVAVLEAMKMKTIIGAHKAGRVTAIYVIPGDGVEADQPLMTIA